MKVAALGLTLSLFLLPRITLAGAQDSVDLQEQADALSQPPPNGVIVGPQGKPRLVLDEGGSWSEPIEVYSNASIREYVPDITSEGWVQWHAQEFKDRGTYSTILYIYDAKTRKTVNYSLTVDTLNRRAVIVQGLVGFVSKLNLAGPETPMTRAVSRITAIVKDDVAGFRGITAEDALMEQRLAVAKMVDGSQSFQHGEKPGEELPVVLSPAGMQVPEVLKSVRAQYTTEAMRAGLRGIVKVAFVVNTSGCPTDIHVISLLAWV